MELYKFQSQVGTQDASAIRARQLDENFARLQPQPNGTYGINETANGWSLNIFPSYPRTAAQALYLAYTGGSLQWRAVENLAPGTITGSAISPGPNGSLFVTENGAVDWSDSINGIVAGDGAAFQAIGIGAGLEFQNNTLRVTITSGAISAGSVPGTAISPGTLPGTTISPGTLPGNAFSPGTLPGNVLEPDSVPTTAISPGPNGSLFITSNNAAAWSSAPPSGMPAWRQVERCDGQRMYVWGTDWATP